jgi:ribosomal protein S18 acetylase RimI-like enzyme
LAIWHGLALYVRMGARVWLAGEEDRDSVVALLAGFRDHMGRDVPTEEGLRATVDVLLRDPSSEYLLAAPDGEQRPAGICQLRYRLTVWTGSDDCWLEDLFVQSEARRAGLGRALVRAAFERAERRGCARMELDVDEDNTGALAFYETLGLSAESKPPGRNLLVGRRL